MKITSKGEYGLRALVDLALHYGQPPRRSREIAEAQGIAEDYLNQLLIRLRQRGLIASVRGPQGGHYLARSPRQITVLDAVLALEGDDAIRPVDFGTDTDSDGDGDTKRGRGGRTKAPTSGSDQTETEPTVDDALATIWRDVEVATTRILGNVTLERLADDYNALRSPIMYHI